MVGESIVEFVERIRSLVEEVNDIRNSSFRKVLYLVMIDGLSSLRFPDNARPGDRFVSFVNIYGGWPDCERVGLPQADLLLRETPAANLALIAAVSERLGKWTKGRLQEVSADPFLQDLPDPTGVLTDCQHSRLLWALRNTLLHEFRHPGYGADVSENRVAPYYIHMTFIDEPLVGESGWELVIPAEFLRRLTLTCLDALQAWLTAQQIDPKAIGYQGRSWVAKLRKLSPLLASS